MSEELTVDQVIATYLQLRKNKTELEEETKTRVHAIKQKMATIEAWIQAKSDETGVKSFKTNEGTAFMTTSDFASVADWDAVLEFVRENEAWEMLTRGVNKTAVRGHIDETQTIPPGVNFGTKISVNVRSPSKRA
tara:strand:+ start:484 stop:888 length:405 start_codon:yes stop_codon:yes gene_type:complete